MALDNAAGPTAAEKELFLQKIQEWREQGFDVDELEGLLEADFNEFLRRRHHILKQQVSGEQGPTPSAELAEKQQQQQSQPQLQLSPDHDMHEMPTEGYTEDISEPVVSEDSPETEKAYEDEGLLLLGEPLLPEDEPEPEMAEEGMIVVGKSPRTPKSKVHRTREKDRKKDTSEAMEFEEDSEESDLESSEDEIDEDDLESTADDDDSETSERRERYRPKREDVERPGAGGKIVAAIIVITVILAGFYFLWGNPIAIEEQEDLSAAFEISPNLNYYDPGSIITLDASHSSGKNLKYNWIVDDDFKVTEGDLQSKILNGYFIATENVEKTKSITMKVTGNDKEDSISKEIIIQPSGFEIAEEMLVDSGEFKVNGYLDLSNPNGITSFSLDEYDADITVNKINIKFNTHESEPMTMELNSAENIMDGFRQTHSVYERIMEQDLVLSGTVSGIANVENLPSGFPDIKDYPFHTNLDGTLYTLDKSYTDLKTQNTIYSRAENDFDLTLPIDIQGWSGGEYTFTSNDDIESYPDLQKNPRRLRLVDLTDDELEIGDSDAINVGNTIYLWRAEKIEYLYERPVIKVNLTVDSPTMARYNLQEFYLAFWIAEDISQPVKTYLYLINKETDTTTTLEYISTMSDFQSGTSSIADRTCSSSTPDGHFYSRNPGYDYISAENWTYLPPTGKSTRRPDTTTSFDAFTHEQAIGIAMGDQSFQDYLNTNPDSYVVSGYCSAAGEEHASIPPGTLAWNLTFGNQNSKNGFNIIISHDGSITTEQLEIDLPPNATYDFAPLLTFAGSEDILLNYSSVEFYNVIFNTNKRVDFYNVSYGISTDLSYPNVDITSIGFVEHSRYSYTITYRLEDKESGSLRMVSVALDAETGQLQYYWDHTDDGLNIF